MPRIATSLLRKARVIHPYLPALLAPCRDLQAARNELRWLREHVERVAKARRARGDALAKHALLRQLVKERASGKPIQYILGTEYFGDLEIRCKPGVLIPRADTAASITYLVQQLRDAETIPQEFRVLDLCTGTGCIPLLFLHEFYRVREDVQVRAVGIDISAEALDLATYNCRKTPTIPPGNDIHFLQADVLAHPCSDKFRVAPPVEMVLRHHGLPLFWDILISNPPYISPTSYWKTTTRSVRGFEPKLALVPPASESGKQSDIEQGDFFYPRLLNIARDVEAKIVLLEVADVEQARRVAALAQGMGIFDGIEIWRDLPGDVSNIPADDNGVTFVGEGQARSVVCWRRAGAAWLRKTSSTSTAEDSARLFHVTTYDESPSGLPHFDSGQMQPSFDRKTFQRASGGALPMHKPNPKWYTWYKYKNGS